MNEEQKQIVANYMGLHLDQMKACNDMVENGVSKYAAQKKYGLTPNTVKRHVSKFEKLLTILKALGEAQKNKLAVASAPTSGYLFTSFEQAIAIELIPLEQP